MSIRATPLRGRRSDREVDLRDEPLDRIDDDELLWVDITGDDDADVRIVRDALRPR